jgi:FKBP-type peptidyl-prolyl cis-trans isomerase (trigger factor)
LVLREIGKAEKVEVSDEELQAEVEKMAKSYSKESLEKIDIGQLKEYAKGAIYNEKVLNKLESYSAK